MVLNFSSFLEGRENTLYCYVQNTYVIIKKLTILPTTDGDTYKPSSDHLHQKGQIRDHMSSNDEGISAKLPSWVTSICDTNIMFDRHVKCNIMCLYFLAVPLDMPLLSRVPKTTPPEHIPPAKEQKKIGNLQQKHVWINASACNNGGPPLLMTFLHHCLEIVYVLLGN